MSAPTTHDTGVSVTARRPTPAQARVLLAGLLGPVNEDRAAGFRSAKDGRVVLFWAQQRVVKACKAAGWLDDEGRTTPAGQAWICDAVLP